MEKKRIIIAALLILIFAEFNIDFAIGIGGSGLLWIVTLGTVFVTGLSIIVFFLLKKKKKAISNAVVLVSVIIGTVIGNIVIEAQFEGAKADVEGLAEEIKQKKEINGVFPQRLSELDEFEFPGYVDVGFLRKRPLHYATRENGKGVC